MTDPFDPRFALDILPLLLAGLVRTIEATVAGAVLAFFVGFLFFAGIGARSRWIAAPLRFVVDFIRSTPLLVQLYFAYFILPDIGLDLSPLAAGCLVLGVHYACYAAEVFRAARFAVPVGTREAATALGLRPLAILRRIVLPQMVPILIPGLGNCLIALFKETPALSAITVAEMLFTAKIIGAEEFRYLEPMTLCGLIYLVGSVTMAASIAMLRRRLRWITI